jgi:hypothetical protein
MSDYDTFEVPVDEGLTSSEARMPRRKRTSSMLQDEIVELLGNHEEGLAGRRVASALRTTPASAGSALQALCDAGLIQRFDAPQAPGDNGDEFWCLAGRVPVPRDTFRAGEILAGFQRACLAQGSRHAK